MNWPFLGFFFFHHLNFWTLNFNGPYILQKTFVPYGFLFNNIYLPIYYYPTKFISLVLKHPVYVYIYIYCTFIFLQFKFNFDNSGSQFTWTNYAVIDMSKSRLSRKEYERFYARNLGPNKLQFLLWRQ